MDAILYLDLVFQTVVNYSQIITNRWIRNSHALHIISKLNFRRDRMINEAWSSEFFCFSVVVTSFSFTHVSTHVINKKKKKKDFSGFELILV